MGWTWGHADWGGGVREPCLAIEEGLPKKEAVGIQLNDVKGFLQAASGIGWLIWFPFASLSSLSPLQYRKSVGLTA